MSTTQSQRPRTSLFAVIGLFVLVAAYLTSAIWVGYRQWTGRESGATQRRTLRVVHSLASPVVRAEFDRLARQYQQLHPDVRVIIQTIPARAYKQWVTTQLIGGNPPDLIQAQSQWDATWTSLATRYLTPLTQQVAEPNPYNDGAELAGVPWRETYIDGMRGGYWPHLTEFYSIPLTMETNRIFYNKDLFRAATGSDAPPENFTQWMDICDRIRDYAAQRNEIIFPIATAAAQQRTNLDMFTVYSPVLTGGMGDPYDTGYWGFPGDIEMMVYGVYNGAFDLKQDRIRAAFEITRELAENFQPGFANDDTAQVRFHFIQGRAGMIIGNIKDYSILTGSADFEIGVMDFPLPTRAHPRYGQYVAGPASEEPLATFHFTLSRASRHGDLALDFMKFCSSLDVNEQLNANLYWFPAIRHAVPRADLEPFRPHIEGAARYPDLKMRGLSGACSLWFLQNYPRYVAGQIEFEPFIDEYIQVIRKNGARDLMRRDELFQRVQVQTERNIAKSKMKMLFEEAGDFSQDQVVGQRTTYQLAIEVRNLLDQGITQRAYVWRNLQEDNYPFP